MTLISPEGLQGEAEMICQANFKDSAVKLTQKRAIPLTAAVLVKISRVLTLGAIVMKIK